MTLITNFFKQAVTPSEFNLKQNYPNPFNANTTIKYFVPYKTKVIIIIINSNGDIVEKLISREQESGIYDLELRADGLPEGTYYYQMIADKFSDTKKMELKK